MAPPQHGHNGAQRSFHYGPALRRGKKITPKNSAMKSHVKLMRHPPVKRPVFPNVVICERSVRSAIGGRNWPDTWLLRPLWPISALVTLLNEAYVIFVCK